MNKIPYSLEKEGRLKDEMAERGAAWKKKGGKGEI
jgi:hypothetical protein